MARDLLKAIGISAGVGVLVWIGIAVGGYQLGRREYEPVRAENLNAQGQPVIANLYNRQGEVITTLIEQDAGDVNHTLQRDSRFIALETYSASGEVSAPQGADCRDFENPAIPKESGK